MKTKTAAISIVGMGYVGLCTAATFAFRGVRTIGIDIDEVRVEQIRKGKAPFHEPHLDGMLKNTIKRKLLDATNDISSAADTDTTFLTVGTPVSRMGPSTSPTSRTPAKIWETYCERNEATILLLSRAQLSQAPPTAQ